MSLDAPLVAVAWLFMFARAWRVDFHPWQAYAALGLTVWIIYVVDRLIDVRMRSPDDPMLGSRHHFHQKHWKKFLLGVVVAAATVLWLTLTYLPVEVIGYSIPIMLLVGVFFALVVMVPATRDIPYLRNIVAGMTFGMGTALVAHVYVPMEPFWIMMQSREVISFGVLCVLNISAIHLWEHSRLSNDPEIRAADEISLTLPLILLGAASLWFAYQDNPGMFGGSVADTDPLTRPFFYGVLISAALLQVINRTRERYSMDALRCLADAAMIVPLPLFIVFSGT
ncbi:hypothetical protein ACFQY0_07735 [Haloferula chungangensis]|uniref:Prenyltransferase n=1 Tax=Haloferula chungangensis TaxID=1048331 RepID=A0ABW2L6Y7_9BACT